MRFKTSISKLISETIFPENIYCIGCGSPINKQEYYSLCSRCREDLLYDQPDNCIRCGRFVKRRSVSFCEHCGGRPPKYDRATAAVVYNDVSKRIIYGLKYGGKGYLAKNAAQLMQRSVENLGDHDIMIPVPMHKSKMKERGFCQTTLISERLSELTGLPVSSDSLVRVKATAPMSGLETEERKRNIKGAFGIGNTDNVYGKKILLIDDLLTTGSTAEECAEVLKDAGALWVSLAVLASPYIENNN